MLKRLINMKYSDTGIFTKEQIRLAKNIARNIKKLRESGCTILAKQEYLHAYLNENFAHAEPLCRADSGYRIPFLDCGKVNDSGADDEEFFVKGYIIDE